MKKRIAIIGAGPSGLAQLRAFQSLGADNNDKFEVVCFEKQNDWGGLWNYSWRTGLDQFGEPVHCSMYRYLWSNGPKECLEFADYSFDEHFGRAIGSYPPREVLWDYIQGRVKKAGLRKFIKFNQPVRMVNFLESSQRFNLISHDVVNNVLHTEEFDHVVVANGHFSVPNVPEFEGFDTFNGRILHAHDFRDALEFKGKDILLIGTSYSAEDIGSQCHKYGARSITVSHRTKAMGFKWPNNWREVPLLTRLKDNVAYFKDGSSQKVDAIILCTGYQHSFPFLANDLRLITKNRLWPLGLYQGVAWEENPKLFYLGMQDQFYTFNMFDAQAWLVRDMILGKIKLPDKTIMRAHSQAWRTREESLVSDEDKIYFQGDYVKELLSQTDYPRFDIEAVNKTFLAWEHHKHADILGFRNQRYTSLITGSLACRQKTPWINAMDDSLESFLSDGIIAGKTQHSAAELSLS